MYQRQIKFGRPITPVVKYILIINITFFLIAYFFQNVINFNRLFILTYSGVFENLYIWQIVTYMLVHFGFLSILFSSIALWLFGSELESNWGSSFFLKYYLFSGIGTAFFILLTSFIFKINIPLYSSTACILAMLLAYGITWPNREILVFFIFPLKVKYLVIIYGAFAVLGSITSLSGLGADISFIAHLGGLISGFIILQLKASTARKSRNSSFIDKKVRKQKNKKHKELIDKRIKAQKIIDEMLEKIAESGMESLTPQEKKDLEWARKNYYPDNKDIIH